MKRFKKIVFYSHINSGNRGCEAILRSTCDILALNENKRYAFSDDIEEDTLCGIHRLVKLLKIPHIFVKRFKPIGSIIPRMLRVFKIDKNALWKYKYNRYKKLLDTDTLCLSTGGDIYCYGDSDWLTYLNTIAKKQGAKTVLWGCSLEESLITENIKKDLKNYSLITVRESITKNTLANLDIKANVVYYPDPAFCLKSQKTDMFEWRNMGKLFGLNLSVKVLKDKNVFQAFVQLIQYIISNTEYEVLLVPHVFWNDENDLEVLRKLYDSVGSNKKIHLINQKQNCCQLKDMIAHCTIYMGARTHSVIAAYSSCVPAIALSYSIKSRGIARDIFGTEEKLVVQMDEHTTFEKLKEAFCYLVDNHDFLKRHLTKTMPEYISKIDEQKEVLEKLL